MDFANEAQAEGQVGQTGKSIVHGADVVDHLGNIFYVVVPLRLEFQQIFKGALSALNLRTQYGFVADVHGDEEVGIGENGGATVQTSQGLVGLGQKGVHLGVAGNGRVGRQRRWDEGPVAGQLLLEAPGA